VIWLRPGELAAVHVPVGAVEHALVVSSGRTEVPPMETVTFTFAPILLESRLSTNRRSFSP